MLNWICPECGRECSPARRQCPACAEAAAASEGIAALMKALCACPPALLLTPAAMTVPQACARIYGSVALMERPPCGPPPESRPEPPSDGEGVGAILASFRQAPGERLLEAPAQVTIPPRAAMLNCVPPPRPPVAARAPLENGRNATAAVHEPHLAGPLLPPELKNFRASAPSLPTKNRRSPIPAWFVSVVAAMGIFLGAGVLLQRLTANLESPAAAASKPADSAGIPAGIAGGTSSGISPASPAPAAAAPVAEAHPLGRFVEVTGLRVVVDLQRRSQLQYLVVNHSPTPLSDLALRIAVRSTAGSNADPLFRVAAVVPRLGAFEAKEIRTDLDTQLRSTAVPDWDSLKADVQVLARQ